MFHYSILLVLESRYFVHKSDPPRLQKMQLFYGPHEYILAQQLYHKRLLEVLYSIIWFIVLAFLYQLSSLKVIRVYMAYKEALALIYQYYITQDLLVLWPYWSQAYYAATS